MDWGWGFSMRKEREGWGRSHLFEKDRLFLTKKNWGVGGCRKEDSKSVYNVGDEFVFFMEAVSSVDKKRSIGIGFGDGNHRRKNPSHEEIVLLSAIRSRRFDLHGKGGGG